MSLVAPAGSGKTTFLHKLSASPVFQPRYQSILFFIETAHQHTTNGITPWSKILLQYKPFDPTDLFVLRRLFLLSVSLRRSCPFVFLAVEPAARLTAPLDFLLATSTTSGNNFSANSCNTFSRGKKMF